MCEYVSCCDLQFGVFSLFIACIFSYFFNADKDFLFLSRGNENCCSGKPVQLYIHYMRITKTY